MSTTKLVEGLEGVKGKTYIADSLKFIHSYKKPFSTVLGKIAKQMNEKDALITAMNELVDNNEDFKELIDILVPYYDTSLLSTKVILEKTKNLTNTDDDYYKLVKPSIEYLYSTDAKERIHTLLIDILKVMINNPTLMKEVEDFKINNKDWKKMVGMLIPEGASVMLTYPQTERNTSDWNPFFWNDIFRKTSGKPIKCTVSKRGLMDLDGVIKKFKKQIMLPKELLFKLKRGANSEVLPEYIELINPKTGEEASGAVATTVVASVPKGEEKAEEAGAAAVVVAAVVAAAATAEAKGASGATAATGSPGASGTPVASTPVATVASGATAATGSPGASGSAAKPVAEPVTTAVTPQVNLEDIKVTVATETPRAGGIMHGDQQVEASAGDEMSDGIYGRRGGSQRLTRKNKKSIGAVRKTRTNH